MAGFFAGQTARAAPALGLIASLVRLGRPLHLVGGVVYYGVGVALAWSHGATLDWAALVWGQLSVTAGQLATHYTNDYYDLGSDMRHRYRPRWSGGSRVLVRGELPPRWALLAATGALVVAIGSAALALAARPEATTGLLWAAALLIAWGYSSPPLRLAGTGAGEIGGAVLLAAMTPMVGYLLQGATKPAEALALLTPLVALQFAMLVAVSLPDHESDAASLKGTLAVRLGPEVAARTAAGLIIAAYIVAAALVLAGVGPAAAYLMWLPLGLVVASALWAGDGQLPNRWDRLGLASIALVVGAAASLGLAVIWARPAAG